MHGSVLRSWLGNCRWRPRNRAADVPCAARHHPRGRHHLAGRWRRCVVDASQLSRASGAIEQIIDRAPFGPISIDVTATQIPWMLSAPTFDPGGAQYAWTESADGTADTVIANANISRPAAGNVPAVVWRHQIVAPHAVGRLHVPVLPAAMTANSTLSPLTPSMVL